MSLARLALAAALLLSLAPARALAQPCNGPNCSAVPDLGSVLSNPDARVEGLRQTLDKADWKGTKDAAHQLAESLVQGGTKGGPAMDAAKAFWNLANTLQQAWDALASGKGDLTTLLRQAEGAIQALLDAGLISPEQAAKLREELATLTGLAKGLATVQDLLAQKKYDSAKTEANAQAEALRKGIKAGTMASTKAQPVVDALGKLWNEAEKAASALAKHSPVPSGSHINSDYGWRIHPVYGTKKFHTGVDIPLNYGTDLYATGTGTVEWKGVAGGYGNQIKVRMADGSLVTYSHLKDFAGHKVGDAVKAGDVVAHVNTTGTSTGNHLHLEVYDAKGNRQDPEKWFGL